MPRELTRPRRTRRPSCPNSRLPSATSITKGSRFTWCRPRCRATTRASRTPATCATRARIRRCPGTQCRSMPTAKKASQSRRSGPRSGARRTQHRRRHASRPVGAVARHARLLRQSPARPVARRRGALRLLTQAARVTFDGNPRGRSRHAFIAPPRRAHMPLPAPLAIARQCSAGSASAPSRVACVCRHHRPPP